jgi:hypothetical protein
MNNIANTIRRKRKEELVSIKLVKPGVYPSIALLKIAPSVPQIRINILASRNRIKKTFRA